VNFLFHNLSRGRREGVGLQARTGSTILSCTFPWEEERPVGAKREFSRHLFSLSSDGERDLPTFTKKRDRKGEEKAFFLLEKPEGSFSARKGMAILATS